MSHWTRKYFLLKTPSGEAIGAVTILVAVVETGPFYFSLHRPAYIHTDAEFLDLNNNEIPHAEFDTHTNVFETVSELNIVQSWRGTGTASFLVTKKDLTIPPLYGILTFPT
jgi:hypothetical protein